MVSRILDSSDNDFSLIEPIVGRDTAEAFIRFFRAQDEMTDLAKYTDDEISHLTVARKYQIVQQCLYAAAAKPEEAEALWRDSEQSSRPGSGMYCPEKSRISA
jgi:hypothetical protein